MTAERASLPVRAYRHLIEHGPVSFARATVNYLSMRLIHRQAVSARDLNGVTTRWYTDPEGWVRLGLPEHPQVRQALSPYPRVFYLGSRFVCELAGCHLVGDNAVGIHDGRHILLETTGNRLGHRHCGGSYPELVKYAVRSTVDRSPPRCDETLFPLICPDPSYYHWMMEYLPKLRLLELYQHRTGRQPKILVEHDPRPFVRQTLTLAGYGPEWWVEWDRRPSRVRRLVVASHRAHKFDYEVPQQSEYRPSPTDVEWLRNRFRSAVESSGDASRRIYIERQRAARGRRVVNYDEVMTELRRRGFEAHTLEAYSISEQVRLLSESDVIMGPHGAGLLNMLFADAPHVIELFPETVIKPHFYFLSSMLPARYDAIVTEARENNLLVDMDSFRARLDQLGLDSR